MRVAIYPGSFDPFTNGHLDVLKKAAALFDEVIVLISTNHSKVRRIDSSKMQNAIEETLILEKLKNVRVVASSYLTVSVAAEENAKYLIRGLRNATDYGYEENIAQINEYIDANIETVYFRAGKNGHISSSAVMELRKFNFDVAELVPGPVKNII